MLTETLQTVLNMAEYSDYIQIKSSVGLIVGQKSKILDYIKYPEIIKQIIIIRKKSIIIISEQPIIII